MLLDIDQLPETQCHSDPRVGVLRQGGHDHLLEAGELEQRLAVGTRHLDRRDGLPEGPVKQLLDRGDIPLLGHRDELINDFFHIFRCDRVEQGRPEPVDLLGVRVARSASVAREKPSVPSAFFDHAF